MAFQRAADMADAGVAEFGFDVGAVRVLGYTDVGRRYQARRAGLIDEDLHLGLAWSDIGQSRSQLSADNVRLERHRRDGRQDGDDGHHDHQFDEREALLRVHDSPCLIQQSPSLCADVFSCSGQHKARKSGPCDYRMQG
ncbi:hypothetical protein D3C71_1627630 [compost metagenome]